MDAVTALLRRAPLDLTRPGLPELAGLHGCPQTVAHHGEGDVAVHTALVVALADQLAADLTADPGHDLAGGAHAADTLRLAALLHDAGKPETTRETEPGRFSARGHDDAGARLVATLFGTHPALLAQPAGMMPAVHALVRNHMWSYHIDRVSPGAMLRASHLADPRLQVALWQADTRGRVCDDADRLADQVAYAALVLEDQHAAHPDSYGPLEAAVADLDTVPAWVRRQVFRDAVLGEVRDQWTAAARMTDLEANPGAGSLTYTIGLPGLGKSTWARGPWRDRTDGVVLSAEGARRRDRRDAAAHVVAEIPRLLAAGAHVCIDATHVARESRDITLAYAAKYRVPVHAVYFDAPLRLALARQDSRPAADAVPATAVAAMRAKLRWPTPDEYATLTVVDADGSTWPYTPATRWATRTERRAAAQADTSVTGAGR